MFTFLIAELWKGLGNKNNTKPYDARLTEINPKQQRIITINTKHLPREKREEELITSSKIIKKITKAEEAKQKIQSSKSFKQQEKINEFKDLLTDEKLSLIFRQMLRSIDSKSLELLLFKNTTDSLPNILPREYALISDDEIKIKFDELESHYHFFSDDDEQAKSEFVTLFKGCKLIADYIEKNNDDDNDVAALHAYKMLVLFGYNENKKEKEKSYSFQNVEAYLDQHGDSQSTHPIHDLFLNDIPINQPVLKDEIKDITGWRKLIQKYGKQAIDYFQQGLAIEHILKHAPLDLDEANKTAAKITYARYQEYPELAKLCLQYHLSEDNFNKCLEIDKKRKSFDLLPVISIDGKDIGQPNYFLVKLPIDDPRAYVLGYITHCCEEVERIAEGSQYGDSKFQSLIYLDQEKLNKLTNELVGKNDSDWDTETLYQIIDIDKIYSTEQIKRIDSLFLQKDSNIIWDQVSGNDRNLPQSERQKIMNQFFVDHKLLFNHDVIAIMFMLQELKVLNSEYIKKLHETLSSLEYPSDFIFGMRILGYAGLINAANIDLIFDNTKIISDNAKNYEVLLRFDLLTENVLETTFKHPEVIESTKSATGLMAKENILTDDTLKLIFDVYIATKGESTDYTAEYQAEEKVKSVANSLIALHKANIPLTDETILNAFLITPNSMVSLIAGFTGAMQLYNKNLSPVEGSHEAASKFIDARVLINIFKKLLAGKYINEDEIGDERENLLAALSGFSILMYKKGIMTNENFDEIISHLNNPDMFMVLRDLVEEDLLVNANFTILKNNAKDAKVIANEMVKLKKSLTHFVEQLTPREKSAQFLSIFSSDDPSTNQRYVEVANKILQILQGEKPADSLDASDREIIKKNKHLSNIINECAIIPNLLNLVDKNEQLYFLILEESPDNFSFDKDHPFTVVSPRSKEDITRIYNMAGLMGMGEPEMLPLNMSKQEFNQLLNKISSGDSGLGFSINENGRNLLKSTNEQQQDKSLGSESVMSKKKT